MVCPEGALQPVLWQLVPEKALHLPAGAGAWVSAGLRGCYRVGRGAQTCMEDEYGQFQGQQQMRSEFGHGMQVNHLNNTSTRQHQDVRAVRHWHSKIVGQH